MRRILGTFVITILGTLCLAATSKGDVEGTWDVDGVVAVKLKLKGYGSSSEKMAADDTFVFGSDGSFSMTDAAGTWEQVKKKVVVDLDEIDLEATMEEMLESEGIDASVDISSDSFKCKWDEKRDLIKGKWQMKATIFVYEVLGQIADVPGVFSVAVSFAGTRRGGSSAASATSAGASIVGGETPLAETLGVVLLDAVFGATGGSSE